MKEAIEVILNLFFIGIIISFFYWLSYKIQKKISNKPKPNLSLVFILTFLLTLIFALLYFIFDDVFFANSTKRKEEKSSIKSMNTKENKENKENNPTTIHEVKNMLNNISSSSPNMPNLANLKPQNLTEKENKNNQKSKTKNEDNVKTNPHSSHSFVVERKEENLFFILSILNFIFAILLPFLIIYYYETTKENFLPNRNENEYFDEEDMSNSGINNSEEHTQSTNFQIFKNYFYYLVILFSINTIFYVIFNISFNNSKNNMAKFSNIPHSIRILAYISQTTEILNLANIEIVLILGKILLMVYLPYGLSILIKDLVFSLKAPVKIKREFKNLNADIAKNYETIKKITSEKIMVGKGLSKKEKNDLKEAKSRIDILEHKQEVLDEKVSIFETLKLYLLFPLKFISTFLLTFLLILLVLSKIITYFNVISNTYCGVECGFLSESVKNSFTLETFLLNFINKENYYKEESFNRNSNTEFLQSILSYFYNTFYYLIGSQKIVVLTIILYLGIFISAVVKGLEEIGVIIFVPFKILCYKEDSVKSNHFLNLFLYLLFSLLIFSCIIEVFITFPDIVNFGFQAKNCSYSTVSNTTCELSTIGLFWLKLKYNFSTFSIFYIVFELIFLSLIVCLFTFYGIKAIISTKTEEEERNEKDKRLQEFNEEEREIITEYSE